jgi:uncharacterized membrane protein (Fun14 family)
MANQPVSQPGWIVELAAKINIDEFLLKFNLTTASLIEILTYSFGGILVGFLSRRYLKHVIIFGIALFLLLKGLEYTNITVVAFNWTKMKELTGIGPNDTVSNVLQNYACWIQDHMPLTIGTLIGFAIGLKLG